MRDVRPDLGTGPSRGGGISRGACGLPPEARSVDRCSRFSRMRAQANAAVGPVIPSVGRARHVASDRASSRYLHLAVIPSVVEGSELPVIPSAVERSAL